jgi:RNA polymerase sigma-70 factor (ECF subfamily)
MQLRKEQHARKHQNQLDKDAISLMDFTEDAHHDRNEIKEIQLNEMNLALKQLNDTQRRCIELFYIQDKSYQQIALETGFTLNEVRSYIQNGKRNLKIHLEKIRERN